MKKRLFKAVKFAAVFGLLLSTYNCWNDDNPVESTEEPTTESRWVTIAGSMQGTTPGDGNGGMLIYSVSLEDAKNPSKTLTIFDNGFIVPSNRTARLNSSNDGKHIYNIPYTGDNGGVLTKLLVGGGSVFTQEGNSVSIAQYATTSPHWGKLSDGNTGVATNIANIKAVNDASGNYLHSRGDASVVSFDLQNPQIKSVQTAQLPLTAAEELLGHHIFRVDAPVLNKAGDKVILGTWMRKTDPATGNN